MQREEFKNWLINQYNEEKGIDANSADKRVSNAQKVEKALGDLDEHFTTDQLSSVLEKLKYTNEDSKNDSPLPDGLFINGNYYTGMATLRQAINRYFEFKNDRGKQISNLISRDALPVIEQTYSKNMHHNTLLLLPVENLHDKKFVIEKYQRGYKWGKKEILELLNDINEYEPNNGVYCIQPIILKPITLDKVEKIEVEDQAYTIYKENEVIDGQQRTTSIYLILEYLRYLGLVTDACRYSIIYKVREKSGAFLTEQIPALYEFLSTNITEKLDEKNYRDLSEVQKNWSEYISLHMDKDFDNVDIYHFFTVCYYIKNWFSQYIGDDKAGREVFADKLINHIHFIWYSLDDSVESKEVVNVFLNNNKGKISLTTSELIKALFILDITNKEAKTIAEYKINRFALEWDMIEKKLQDDTFWYFLQPNREKYNKGTRIDFLFDLQLVKNYDDDDDAFAYRKYENMFNDFKNDRSGQFEGKWGEIVQLYYKLIDWYNDPFTYNFIGFLTVTKFRRLQRILKISKDITKEKFNEELKECIKNEFSTSVKRDNKMVKPYEIDNLHYDNFRHQSQNVILLYNILYNVERMAHNKFPFELYIKEKWSIEHIVPQNPKEDDDFEEYKLWFKDQLDFINSKDSGMSKDENYKNMEVLNKLQKLSDKKELEKDQNLHEQVKKLQETFQNKTHLISNLLLLDRNTNSALGNDRFMNKRKKILEFDRIGKTGENKKVFIPIETLNAFNKTFSDDIEFKHWSSEDGQNYRDSIIARLEYFLPKN